jgi:hypothetical protein
MPDELAKAFYADPPTLSQLIEDGTLTVTVRADNAKGK